MEVRDRIIEEATSLFFKYGIRNVTMDDIAVSVGMSKRTVYENFKDKTELIQTILKHLSDKQDARRLEIGSIASNVIEAIFMAMQDGVKAMNIINPVFFYDLKKYYPAVWKSITLANKEKNSNHTYKQLRKGVNEGLFRKDIDIDIISKLFHEQIAIIGDEKIFPREEYKYIDVFKNVIINFIRGISTKKGIDLIDSMLE
ncbi:TetR/AcrR family transcriptional regulator [Sunxiuqinia sp. A32]|uniref:TetR/AcrR family transcriptional regulator n=1 Tax=Sunxiuqinia sp. A32 TaxID=3461496 RepID=UPI0040456295